MIRTTLLGRVLLGIAALAVCVRLVFFRAAALVLGTAVVTGLLVRHWWITRNIRRAEQADTITTEYTVIDRERAEEPRLPEPARTGNEPEVHGDEPQQP